MREDGICDVEDAKEVCLELGERCEGASLLENGLDAVASVVDNDVDATPDGEGLFHALLYEFRRVGNVELGEVQSTVESREDGAELLEVASGCDDAVPSGEH